MKEPEHELSHEQLQEMFSWAFFDGFTASECCCGRKANVPVGPGWHCHCGHYNVLPWSFHQIPHEEPDLGPTREAIVMAAKTFIVDKMKPGEVYISTSFDYRSCKFVAVRIVILDIGEFTDEAYGWLVYGARCRFDDGSEKVLTSFDLKWLSLRLQTS